MAHVVGLSHATTAQLPSVFADCCRTPVDLVAKLNQMVSEIRASVSVQSPAAQGLLVGSATMRQVPDADALRRREVKTYLAGLKTIAHQLGNGFSRAEASQAANVMRDLCSRLKACPLALFMLVNPIEATSTFIAGAVRFPGTRQPQYSAPIRPATSTQSFS